LETVPLGTWIIETLPANGGSTPILDWRVEMVIPGNTTLERLRTPEIIGTSQTFDYYYDSTDNPGVWVFWSSLITYLTVDNVPYDTGLTVCSVFMGVIETVHCSDSACSSATVSPPVNIIDGSLYPSDLDDNVGYTYAPMDTFHINMDIGNVPQMGFDILGAVQAVIIPPGFSYVPGSWRIDWGHDNIQDLDPNVDVITNPDGSQLLRFTWSDAFSNEVNLAANGTWDGFQTEIKVAVDNGILEDDYDFDYYFAATGSDHPCSYGNENVDEDNYLGGYAFDEDFCLRETRVEIVWPPGAAGLESYKEVQGFIDTDFTRYPNTGTTIPGGVNNYRLTLSNPNSVDIRRINIIDIFPIIGDTEILNPSEPRQTAWRPILAAPISSPPGVQISYTVVDNPCRDEVAGPDDSLPFPTGCTDADWSNSPPDDLTTVTGIKITHNAPLGQGESIELNWEMRAPVDAPTDGSVAWNSFAYIGENRDTGDKLLPAEPIKVGIKVDPPSVPIIGNFVWEDINGNGVQDAGERGINGVIANLYHDTNGNGTAEPGSGDDLVTYTITNSGGQYQFSNFAFGDYYVVFSDLPSGYNITHTDIGDDNLDSDGLITEIRSFTNGSIDRSFDLGLYQGALPNLCDLDVTLTTANSCPVLNQNGGFENMGSASFSSTFMGYPAEVLLDNSTLVPHWTMDYNCTPPCPSSYWINDASDAINNPEGENFIWLNENQYSAKYSLNVVADQCYDISFYAAAYSNSGTQSPADASLEYINEFGSIVNVGTVTLSPSTSFEYMNWQKVSFKFTPTETREYEFLFSLLNPLAEITGGMAIDAVEITRCCFAVCEGEGLSIESIAVTSSGTISNYLWSTGSSAPDITVSPTSDETYSVTVTDSEGCTAEASAEVIVFTTPSPNCLEPFWCDSRFYQTIELAGDYWLYEILTYPTVSISPIFNLTEAGLVGGANSTVFNKDDGYIYTANMTSPFRLYRVGSNNAIQYMGNITGFHNSAFINAAEIVDEKIIYRNVTDADYYELDLTTLAVVEICDFSTVSGSANNIGDFALNPVDGNLYGTRDNTNILERLDLSTCTMTQVTTDRVFNNANGAFFISANGDGYGYENSTGNLYRINLTTGGTEIVGQGSTTSQTDGAFCEGIKFEKTVSSSSAVHCETVTYTFTIYNDWNQTIDNVLHTDTLTHGLIWDSEPYNLVGGIAIGPTSIIGTDKADFNLITIPEGIVSFQIDALIPQGYTGPATYHNQAYLRDLPNLLAVEKKSDYPSTPEIDDATPLQIVDNEPTLDLGSNVTICEGADYTFTPVTTQGTLPFSYSWSGPSGYSSTSSEITVTEEGTYSLTVTDDFGCTAKHKDLFKYLLMVVKRLMLIN